MGYKAYAEVRLLSRDAFQAIFRKGDVFEVTDAKGRTGPIVVEGEGQKIRLRGSSHKRPSYSLLASWRTEIKCNDNELDSLRG